VFPVNCRGHNTEQKYINLLVAEKEQRGSRVGTNPARGCSSSVVWQLSSLLMYTLRADWKGILLTLAICQASQYNDGNIEVV